MAYGIWDTVTVSVTVYRMWDKRAMGYFPPPSQMHQD